MRQLLLVLLRGGDLASFDAADGAPLWTAPNVLPLVGGDHHTARDSDDGVDSSLALTTAIHFAGSGGAGAAPEAEVWVTECLRLVAPCDDDSDDSDTDDAITFTRRDRMDRFTQCTRQRSVPIGALEGDTDDLDEPPALPVRVSATRCADPEAAAMGFMKLELVAAEGAAGCSPGVPESMPAIAVHSDGRVSCGDSWEAEAPQIILAAWLLSVDGGTESGGGGDCERDDLSAATFAAPPRMLPVLPPAVDDSHPKEPSALCPLLKGCAIAASRGSRVLSLFVSKCQQRAIARNPSCALFRMLEEVALEAEVDDEDSSDAEEEEEEEGSAASDEPASSSDRPWWLLVGHDAPTCGGCTLRTCTGLPIAWVVDAMAKSGESDRSCSTPSILTCSNDCGDGGGGKRSSEPGSSLATKDSSSFSSSVLELGASTKLETAPPPPKPAPCGAMVPHGPGCDPGSYTAVVQRLMKDPRVLQFLSSYSPTAPLGQRTWDMFVTGSAPAARCGPQAPPPQPQKQTQQQASPKTATSTSSAGFSAAGSGATSDSAAPSAPVASSSHFLEHYDPLGYVGRGADGQVIKARHRLTLATYAVKIVPVLSDDHARAVQQEVQILAQLSHKNLVRYFHCWLEDVPAAALLRLERIARSFAAQSSSAANAEGVDEEDWAGDDFDGDGSETASSAGYSASAFNTPGIMSSAARDWGSVADVGTPNREGRRSGGGAEGSGSKCNAAAAPSAGGALSSTSPMLQTASLVPDDAAFPDSPPNNTTTAAGASSPQTTPGGGVLVPYGTSADTGGDPASPPGDENASMSGTVRFISEVTSASDAMLPVRVLFIQMEHFPMSLHDHIANRDPKRYPLSSTVTPPATPLRDRNRLTPLSPTLAAAAFRKAQLLERQNNLTIVFDVLTALMFLHEKGIVHRDIKPANIFVDPTTMHTCVGDFGLSKAADDTDLDDDDDGTATAGNSHAATPASLTRGNSVQVLPDASPEGVVHVGAAETTEDPSSPDSAALAVGGGSGGALDDGVGLSEAELAEAETQLERSFATASAPHTPTAPGMPSYITASGGGGAGSSNMVPAPGRSSTGPVMKPAALTSPTTSVVPSPPTPATASNIATPHTAGVGSPLYAAPEQMLGRRNDSLCDAFAAGVVFIELYHAFATVSERIAVLRAAGRGHVEGSLLGRFPELNIAALLASPSRRRRLSVVQARKLVRTALLKISVELDDDDTD